MARTRKYSAFLKMMPKFYPLKCNFHTHFAENYGNGAKAMVDTYYKAGYDCIALTEHDDCIKDLEPEKEAQTYARKKYGSDFLVIIGEEVAFDDTENAGEPTRELLALFIDSYIDCGRDSGIDYSIQSTPTISLLSLLVEIHKQEGLSIVCHDNWFQYFYNKYLPNQGKEIKVKKFKDYQQGRKKAKWFWDYRKGKEIDGWEVGNSSKHNYMLSHPQESVDEGYIVLSNSDAHSTEDIEKTRNLCYTYVFAKERSLEAVKDALLDRRTIAYCNGSFYGKKEWLDYYNRLSKKPIYVEV